MVNSFGGFGYFRLFSAPFGVRRRRGYNTNLSLRAVKNGTSSFTYYLMAILDSSDIYSRKVKFVDDFFLNLGSLNRCLGCQVEFRRPMRWRGFALGGFIWAVFLLEHKTRLHVLCKYIAIEYVNSNLLFN